MIKQKIIKPTITKIMEKKILKNQDNKCAKKPYSRIDGLMNYQCLLWKKNKGKFDNNQYVIIKKNNKEKNSEDNLIAICETCHSVLKNRIKEKQKLLSKNNSESENEEESENNDNDDIEFEDDFTDKTDSGLEEIEVDSDGEEIKVISDSESDDDSDNHNNKKKSTVCPKKNWTL